MGAKAVAAGGAKSAFDTLGIEDCKLARKTGRANENNTNDYGDYSDNDNANQWLQARCKLFCSNGNIINNTIQD